MKLWASISLTLWVNAIICKGILSYDIVLSNFSRKQETNTFLFQSPGIASYIPCLGFAITFYYQILLLKYLVEEFLQASKIEK